jgi:hypothetical protein
MAEHEGISFDEELQRVVDQEPFRPFIVWWTSGDRCSVDNPNWLALGSAVISYLHPTRGVMFFRRNQMVAVEVPVPQQSE